MLPADFPVERFSEALLLWLSRLDVEVLLGTPLEALPNGCRAERRAVVGVNNLGGPSQPQELRETTVELIT